MSRQRAHQLRWLAQGRCPYCAAHPPVVPTQEHCPPCFRRHLARRRAAYILQAASEGRVAVPSGPGRKGRPRKPELAAP